MYVCVLYTCRLYANILIYASVYKQFSVSIESTSQGERYSTNAVQKGCKDSTNSQTGLL